MLVTTKNITPVSLVSSDKIRNGIAPNKDRDPDFAMVNKSADIPNKKNKTSCVAEI